MNTDALMAASDRLRKAAPGFHPRLAVVMGSGWREVSAAFDVVKAFDYAAIPELGAVQVAGHGGRLLLAKGQGADLLVFEGRRHSYEGVGWDPIAFPVCLAKTMGAGGIVLTNSAGGIRESLRPGDVMVMDDHINLMGVNPLVGPHHPFWGPRFPDMTHVYDEGYRRILDRCAARAGLSLSHGVYLAVSGPSYETPAEIMAFRRLGADAVGMSTVPEAILARAAGLKVAGVSCIANAAAGMGAVLTHEDVLKGAKTAIPGLIRLLQEFVSEIANTEG